ncbi:cobalt-precorrin-6A synthase [Duganella sp. Leaf126]|uniref:cobalt-precorrin-5B (C(1))-methyltransferase CbiD n=1 Tax=Duganella sp. Leaf126 TaxID=1736266 RepID=UPI0006F6E8A1|nr:cobalt-precorrin-5B (C(1))-methyltransferase CbiD [Duganella sp. Leaf126]KQQ45106.1 cobalt-precorrin-6A synthase [Duganella sp. Leaf126]
MSLAERQPFDLDVRALNGLRRGRTTGSCATAAVKAALRLLLQDVRLSTVDISLPDGVHYLSVPIQQQAWLLPGEAVRAEVIKDGGDDPDNTHGATIFAEVRRNDAGVVRFFAGRGVGTATLPGLRVAVGEPAINPVPRQMMRLAVQEVAGRDGQGFDLTIGCENGEVIAAKTFNPRLGIVGGISILGTSGIVEPMSLATWIASVEVYIRVALAQGQQCVAYLPGKIGREFARDVLQLPDKNTVQIANFLGDALDFTERVLVEDRRTLDVLWLAGHPGKLAKVIDGWWDTHSSKSRMAMGGVARVAAEVGYAPTMVQQIEQANTVEAAMDILRQEPGAPAFWREIEHRIAALVHGRVPSVHRIEVRLFDLAGNLLGEHR